jgi:hypothetical protein
MIVPTVIYVSTARSVAAAVTKYCVAGTSDVLVQDSVVPKPTFQSAVLGRPYERHL